MAKITISDLSPTESETYISDMTNIDALVIFGGESDNYSQFLYFGFKFLQFVAIMSAVDTISLLVNSFKTTDLV